MTEKAPIIIADEASAVPRRVWEVPVPAPVIGIDIDWTRGLCEERGAVLIVNALYRKRDGTAVRGRVQVIPQSAIDQFRGGLSIFDIIEQAAAPAVQADALARERLASQAAAVRAASEKRARRMARNVASHELHVGNFTSH